MNIDDQIKVVSTQIAALLKKVDWLIGNRAKLDALPQGYMYGDQLDFDNLSHEDVIKVIRTIGGKWKKTPSPHTPGRVDYELQDGPMKVRLWQGQPPPSCRLIEVEEHVPEQVVPEQVIPAKVIPAHVRKSTKMICKPGLVADIAFAQTSTPTTNETESEPPF